MKAKSHEWITLELTIRGYFLLVDVSLKELIMKQGNKE